MAEKIADARARLGRRGEDVATWILERKGWRIVARNVRAREGEIDLVASRAGVLAFVEVKTRRSRAFGEPAEAVTPAKRRKIRTMALRFLAEQGVRAHTVRFDVMEVLFDGTRFRVRHLESAFS